MKKLQILLLTILLIFQPLIISLRAEAAVSGVYFSRISAKNGSEFFEIYNSGSEIRIDKLEVLKGVEKRVIFTSKAGTLPANSYFLVRQSGSGDADGYYDGNEISEKVIFQLKINDLDYGGICSAGASECAKAGMSKNSTDIKGEKVAVNRQEFEKNNLVFPSKKANFEFHLVSNQDDFSHENSGSFLTDDTAEVSENENQDDGNTANNTEKTDENSTENGDSDTSKNDNKKADQDNTNNNSEDSNGEEANGKPPVTKEDFCKKLKLSEIYFGSNKPFIEVENTSKEEVSLENCFVFLGKKKMKFEKQTIHAGEFYVFWLNNSELKNKELKVVLSGEDSKIIDEISAKKQNNKSLAKIDDEWKETFEISAGSKNIFAEILACEDGFKFNSKFEKCEKIPPIKKDENKNTNVKICDFGYFLNEKTGRCNKEKTEIKEEKCRDGYFLSEATKRCQKAENATKLTPCQVGYERNHETNRCRKVSTTGSSNPKKVTGVTPCQSGYERNPETNRCRKIQTEKKEELCKEGYERNLETNRCRKVVKNVGAEHAVKTESDDSKSEFTGWNIVFIVILILLAFVLWEFRITIWRFFAGIFKRNKEK